MGAVPSTTPVQENLPKSASRGKQLEQSREQAITAARVADEMRGQDVTVLDLSTITPIADFFVVVTAASPRQARSIAEEIHQNLKKAGSLRLGVEGEETSSWILQDYGDVVIHVFTTDARKLYDLENLWGDAPRLDWKKTS